MEKTTPKKASKTLKISIVAPLDVKLPHMNNIQIARELRTGKKLKYMMRTKEAPQVHDDILSGKLNPTVYKIQYITPAQFAKVKNGEFVA